MRKEVIIAIVLGLALGLIFTLGVYTANQAVKEKKTAQTVKVVETTPSPSPLASLIIDSPENNLVVDKPQVKITGKTTKTAVVAIYSEEDQVFTQVDEDGFFSANFPLVAGSNKITVKSVDEEDREQEKKLTVVYTTQVK